MIRYRSHLLPEFRIWCCIGYYEELDNLSGVVGAEDAVVVEVGCGVVHDLIQKFYFILNMDLNGCVSFFVLLPA